MKQSDVNVVVVGSINYDITSYLAEFPQANETLFAKDYKTAIGGKGLNQAVAAARIGADVKMIGCVGDDGFGEQAIAHLIANGVDCSRVVRSKEAPTGFAAIMVNDAGDNMISVASGANKALTPKDVVAAKDSIEAADIVITQSEVSADVIAKALEIANASGVPTVLNPAPADPSAIQLLKHSTYVTPNESETETLTGFYPEGELRVEDAIQKFKEYGAGTIVITLGSRGALISDGGAAETVEPFDVTSVDSTGAGDVFNGVFSVSIARGMEPAEAVKYASAAAAISVTRLTADSAPTQDEVAAFLDAQ
ncbi:MAG: ribokinase [Hyphomonadaceae bacterium]|nr:ribokinase [Hyphomonadaceae bacterium]